MNRHMSKTSRSELGSSVIVHTFKDAREKVNSLVRQASGASPYFKPFDVPLLAFCSLTNAQNAEGFCYGSLCM